MCDFSLQSVRSRPAKVGDKLVTRDFGTGTRGRDADSNAVSSSTTRKPSRLSAITFSKAPATAAQWPTRRRG
jgi:hypothetical protein